MHPLFGLLVITLVAVIGFGVWNWLSTKRHQQTGGNVAGIGGVNDPMSGTTTNKIRSGEEIRASLDAANESRARYHA